MDLFKILIPITFLMALYNCHADAGEKLKDFHNSPRIEEGEFEVEKPTPEPKKLKTKSYLEPVPISPEPKLEVKPFSKTNKLEVKPVPEPKKWPTQIKPPVFAKEPVTPKQFSYPLHSTPESLSSLSYLHSEGIHYIIPRIQFHMGQYKFFKGLIPESKAYLALNPRVNFGFVYGSNEQMSYFASTDNRFRVGEYGVGFKLLVESSELDFKKTTFSGILSSYVYKNFNVGGSGKMSVYLGFSGDRVVIKGEPYKYAEEAKKLLFNAKNITAGLWYQTNVLKSLSYSLEVNAQSNISLSLYYGLN